MPSAVVLGERVDLLEVEVALDALPVVTAQAVFLENWQNRALVLCAEIFKGVWVGGEEWACERTQHRDEEQGLQRSQ